MTRILFGKIRDLLRIYVKEWGKADVWLVGGCVRDTLSDSVPKDIDLVVDMENGATLFSLWLESKGYAKDIVTFPRYGTSRFTLIGVPQDVVIECVMPRTETYNGGPRKPDQVKFATIQEDAQRRDFCCNAVYQNLVTLEFFDPTQHGIQDIKDKVLRTPLPAQQTFIDDPLRMLRAFRFSAEKGYKILEEVYNEIKPYPEYTQLSMERVRDEFTRIMLSGKAVETIRELHKTGLLGYIIPELEKSWGFNQNSKYHSMNLTDHTFAVFSKIKDRNRSIIMGMAALLHDIAKYKCWKINKRGEFSYPRHEEESSKMSVAIMKRLKFSGDECEKVGRIIKWHMRLKPFYDYNTDSYNGKPEQTRRIIRDFGDELYECLDLIEADNNSHAPSYNMPGQVKSFTEAMYHLGKVPIIKSCPVNGEEIMSTFGLKPGPVIREYKEMIIQKVDEDIDKTPETILAELKTEFEGKGFWIWLNEFSDLSITEREPGTGPYEIPYDIKPESIESIKMLPGRTPVYWEAKEHPIIYRNFMRSKKARDIFDRASKILDEFYDIQGFDNVSLEFDSEHDLSGVIGWKDAKPDYIM